MVSRALAGFDSGAGESSFKEEMIHTGQHYDRELSHVFFEQMGIPEPAANLGIGSCSHAEMTGRMLIAIESEIERRKPDWLLVYGDTNSTLAGTLAAAKLCIPVAHVEAGLRSFNRKMPEEVNRVLTDHLAQLCLCPTSTAVANLAAEGREQGVSNVGDVMYDAALYFGDVAKQKSDILDRLGLKAKGYYLATVHRAENTNYQERLSSILSALSELAEERPVVLPLHPRTEKIIHDLGLAENLGALRRIQSVPFLDMVRMEQEAAVILTDSGGVQKEAYFHGVPCVTMRDETEWVETVKNGWNQIAGADRNKILNCVAHAGVGEPIHEYGDGNASQAIVEEIGAAAGLG